MVDFCNPSVFWPRISKPGEIIDRQLKCNAIVKEGENDADGELNAYRFAHIVGCTMGQNRKKHSINSHPIILFSHERGSERSGARELSE